jgi:drug/metabolite transporter (DMT)-like permease
VTITPESIATRRRAWLAWASICLIWGTTYLAIKVSLATIPPFVMGGLRYLSGGGILAAVLVARGHALPARVNWGRLAVLAFFMLALGNGGVVWGEQYVPSGLTAVLVGTSPFWMVTVDALLPDGARLHARQWLGLAVGFLGIVLLVWPDLARGGTTARGMVLGVISLQVACAGWSIGSAYTRRHVMPRDVLGSAAVQMMFGGAFMLLAGTGLGEWSRFSLNWRSTLALGYLSLAGSVVAFAAYSYALQHLEVAVVSLYTYINPVIAVALGTLLLGEPFHLPMLVAAAVILFGVVIVRPRTRAKGGSTRRT